MLLGQATSDVHSTATKQAQTRLRLLVLCTGNSARSVMAEALFNSLGATLFIAHSAGSKPVGRVNPLALEQIRQLGEAQLQGLRSKSWDEFSVAGAPEFDVLLTVCDNAAAEVCPTLGGRCEQVHWSLPDPAAAAADKEQERAAFAACFNTIKTRVEALVGQFTVRPGSNDKIHPDAVVAAMRNFL